MCRTIIVSCDSSQHKECIATVEPILKDAKDTSVLRTLRCVPSMLS